MLLHHRNHKILCSENFVKYVVQLCKIMNSDIITVSDSIRIPTSPQGSVLGVYVDMNLELKCNVDICIDMGCDKYLCDGDLWGISTLVNDTHYFMITFIVFVQISFKIVVLFDIVWWKHELANILYM